MLRRLTAHCSRCFIAGTVALLPIGGLALTVVWIESALAESWLARQAWYVPGLGIVATAVLVYAIGLLVSTVIGRWLLLRVDALLHGLPALGRMYATLKQILGYGSGRDAVFRRVVLVPSATPGGHELALVTNEHEQDGVARLTLFVPGAPNPTAGRVVVVDASCVQPCALAVSDALKLLVAVGAGDPLPCPARAAIDVDR